jgi:signal transduction histidine kinase
VRGDGRLLRIAIENLLQNAWKFTGKRPDAVIEFGSHHMGGEQTFYVKDNGVGFDMEFAGRLFGPFQRLHRSEEFPGSGIGLATVRRVIHRHGGQVWAEGKPGEGAKFSFTLKAEG